MRIAILGDGDGWHTRDLQRAGRELGWSTPIWDFRTLHAEVGTTRASPPDVDGLLVRTMSFGSLEQVVFRMDVLHALEASGVPILNPPRALETCIDKYLALVRLQGAGVPVPPTSVCQAVRDAQEAFTTFGGDIVVKPLFGSEGRGMVRLTDAEVAWRTFQTLERTGAVLYVQQYIRHPGWDVRIFVLNGRVLTAMRRTAHADWRTNVAQGANAEPYAPLPTLQELALRAAHAVGAWAAGVDLLQGDDGRWYVLEVNAVPGWKALAPVTGVDVAQSLLRTIADRRAPAWGNAALPAMDASTAISTACLWEATAKKAGNVHPAAHFADLTYMDFVRSAIAIGPVLAEAPGRPLGMSILRAIQATRHVVTSNTNLGIVLLLAPLASVPEGLELANGVEQVLARTTVADAEHVYEAIRLAVPGGLGEANEQDVREQPTQTLRAVMALAADRDLIARQYTNGFADIFRVGVPALREAVATLPLEQAIQQTQLQWLAEFPDSLIARKMGRSAADAVQQQARAVLQAGGMHTDAGRNAYAQFDRFLRNDGHRYNPGTTADMMTACLYIALRQRWLQTTGTL